MARENLVFLRGTVVKKPLVVKKDGEYLYALANINVGRAYREVGDGIKFMKCDNPPIMTRDVDCIKEIETWNEYDIVDVKGVISSKHIKKGSVCPYCGEKNFFTGAFVFVNPIYIDKITSCASQQEALDYLVKHREISNQVFLFGTLCRDPKKIKPKKGLTVTQYQIAMNRKYRIKTDPPEIKTDFPWVKSYGENAIEDHKRLHVGSEVFIDGFLQARSINRKAVCGSIIDEKGKVIKNEDGSLKLRTDNDGNIIGCGKTYEWKDRAMEIVPYGTEYIGEYYSDEEIAEIEEQREAEKIRSMARRNSVDVSKVTYESDEDDGYGSITNDDIDAGIDLMNKDNGAKNE